MHYLSRITTNAAGGGFKKCFPNDTAQTFRFVTVSNAGGLAILRQASNTNNTFTLEVNATQPLGVCDTSDLEVESGTTNTPTVAFFGSHPQPNI